ncbi:epoxide hydrolase [Moniliophthora roreri]|nr:epoxide hydrolase [Moniliophthora roreri]
MNARVERDYGGGLKWFAHSEDHAELLLLSGRRILLLDSRLLPTFGISTRASRLCSKFIREDSGG